MADFNDNAITTAGRSLIAKGIAGAEIRFTRIVIGDGYLTGTQMSETMSDVVNTITTVALTKFANNNNGTAIIGGIFSNDALATGFFFRELALFAEDPEDGEILYCYGNAGTLAEWIPATGGTTIIEKSIDILTIIGAATHVTANISSSTYATKDDISGLQDQIDDIRAIALGIDLSAYYNKQEANALLDSKEPLIKNATAKTTLVDADTIPLSDSAASNATKKITWANIKAALKTYFDTLYSKVVVNNTLTSTSTTEALSAAQGRELKALTDGKEPLVKNAATKTTLANADTFVISDSADSNNTKKISWGSVNSAINNVYGSSSIAATLTTGGWNGSKEQAVAVSGLTTASIAAFGLAVNATDAQYEAASNAKIRVVSQVSGSFTVRCMGTAPTVSIPIVVNVSQW